MADLISTLGPARVLILLYSAAGSGIVRERKGNCRVKRRGLCASARETQTPSTSTNRYISTSGGRTRAQRHLQSLPAAACSPRTSTWLWVSTASWEGNFSRIAQIHRVNDPFARRCNLLLFFPSRLCCRQFVHSYLPDREDSRISLLCSPP